MSLRDSVFANAGSRTLVRERCSTHPSLLHKACRVAPFCFNATWHRTAPHHIASNASHRIASHRIASHSIASHQIAQASDIISLTRLLFGGSLARDQFCSSRGLLVSLTGRTQRRDQTINQSINQPNNIYIYIYIYIHICLSKERSQLVEEVGRKTEGSRSWPAGPIASPSSGCLYM